MRVARAAVVVGMAVLAALSLVWFRVAPQGFAPAHAATSTVNEKTRRRESMSGPNHLGWGWDPRTLALDPPRHQSTSCSTDRSRLARTEQVP